MKHTLLTLTLLFICLSGFAQSGEIDAKVIEAYGESKVQWMSENAPHEIERIQDVLLYSYDLLDVTSENSSKLPSMKEIVLDDISSLNILLIANEPMKNEPQFFYLSNQNKILRVKTEEEFDNYSNSAKKN